jgi:hypothetical protein
MCFGDEVPIHPTHLGFIDPNCYVEDTIRGLLIRIHHFVYSHSFLEAFENAQFLCEGYYLTSPSLVLRSLNGTHQSFFLFLQKILPSFRSNKFQ